jgi:Lysyl oxidase
MQRGLVYAVAGSACLLAGPASPARADHPLAPDLQTMEIEAADLEVYQPLKGKTKTLLGITNEVGNAGAGPLEITPSASTPDCDDPSTAYDEYTASQTIYEDFNSNGYFERGVDTEKTQSEIGCLVFHDHRKHNHWHVLDFSKYSLVSEKTADVAESQKVGFCLLDLGTPFPVDPPGTPGSGYFQANCSFGDSSTPPPLMGISVGYSDVYGIGTPGQQIRVDGLPKGSYCLRSEADPVDNIIETDDLNNATEVRIRLNPAKLRVTELAGPCLSG